jgi:hypothetical protein
MLQAMLHVSTQSARTTNQATEETHHQASKPAADPPLVKASTQPTTKVCDSQNAVCLIPLCIQLRF